MCETNRGTCLKEGFGSSIKLRSEDEIQIQSALVRVLVGKGNVISYSNDFQDFDFTTKGYILEASASAP